MAKPWEEYQSNSPKPWEQYQEEKPYTMAQGVSDLVQTNVDALPLYGQAIGGLLGPVAAGIGQAAGESLRQGINSSVDSLKKGTFIEDNLRLPTKDQVVDIANSTMKNFNEGATAEMAGRIIGKGVEKLGEKVAVNKAAKQAAQAESEASAKQAQQAESTAQGAAKAQSSIESGAMEIEQGGQLFKTQPPKNIKEMRDWKPSIETGEMPQKERLLQIQESIPDLAAPPTKYHYDMLEDPKSMKKLKIEFENLPTEDARKMATYNQEMVNDSGRKVKSLIQSISGGEPKPVGEAAENFLTAVKGKYKEVNKNLKPAFEEMQKKGVALSSDDAKQLITAIGDNTKVGKLIQEIAEPVMQDGQEVGQVVKYSLAKNAPRSGLSDDEYSVIKRVVDDLNDGVSFEEIQKIRDFLRKSIDPTNPRASEEIGKVRSVLLSALEDMTPANVQPVMKDYAINQRALENIESIIGGKIESLDQIYAANPDKVAQKIFSNKNYAKIVHDYIGADAYNELLSSYVNNGIRKSFDATNGFNPVALRSWIKSNKQLLDNYVQPEVADQLSKLADYGYLGKRFLDEVNPSGTAASLEAMLKPQNFYQKVRNEGVRAAVESSVANAVTSKVKQNQAVKSFSKALGEQEPVKEVSKLSQRWSELKNSPKLKGDIAAKATSATIVNELKNQEKGEAKWASQGAQKLLDSGLSQEKIDKLMKTTKGKSLLIQASDLKKDSKALQNLIKEIGD